MTLKLIGNGLSPFVRKTRIALAEKGLAYEHDPMVPVGVSAEYKKKHGFVRFDIPRYYIPLTAVGRVAIRCRLYRGPAALIPKPLRDKIVSMRAAWYARNRSSE